MELCVWVSVRRILCFGLLKIADRKSVMNATGRTHCCVLYWAYPRRSCTIYDYITRTQEGLLLFGYHRSGIV